LNVMDNVEIRSAGGMEPTAFGVVRPYAETLAMVAASTLVGIFVAPRWGNSPVDLLYLPAVLAAAGLYGLGPGLVAAVASALTFNYYFTAPYHTFRIASPQDIATVALLFVVALVTSQLAARMRAQALKAQRNAIRNSTIAGLARRLLSCPSQEQIARVACRELGRLFDCNAVLMAGSPEPKVIAAKPSHAALTPSDMVAAAFAIDAGKPTGRGMATADATEWAFYPIWTDTVVLGAVGLARDDGLPPVPFGQRDLLGNLIDQVALALERGRLEAEARSVEELRERNRIRSTLLSTIGQDVSPRLTAISGAIGQLRRSGSADKEPVSTIGAEVSKLQQYLSNLLEIGPDAEQKPVEAGSVTIDLLKRTVARSGTEIHLTPTEYAVLAELAKYPGHVLTHAHLLKAAWGPAQENQTEYLRVAVRSLRQKLEDNPSNPQLIINEPAVGYRLTGG
jgi:two-component system sensor histidine kinase KdpD